MHIFLTFWSRSAAVTVGLPWSSVGLSTSYRGNPRVPRQGPRLSIVHGASTESATVVAMRRAAVLSVATSVGPAMAIHGSTTATTTVYSMVTSTSIAAAIHGNQWRMPRHSTAIAMATSTDVNQLQFPRTTTVFLGHPRLLPRQFRIPR